MEQLSWLIIWKHHFFEGPVFLLGYFEKYGFFKGQKHLLILLGFWDNFVIIFTGIALTWYVLSEREIIRNSIQLQVSLNG